MENDKQLMNDKGNGGEERRRHILHYSEWSGGRKSEVNEEPGSHLE